MEKIFLVFYRNYTDISYELKNKIKIFVILCSFSAVISFAIGILDLFSDVALVVAVIELLGGIIFAIPLLLTYLGRYKSAYTFFLFFLSIIFFAVTILYPLREIDLVYKYGFYLLLIVIACVVLTFGGTQMVALAIFNAICFSIVAYLVFSDGLKNGHFTMNYVIILIEVICIVSVGIFIAGSGIRFIRNTINYANNEAQKNNEKAESIKNVILSSKQSLSIGNDLCVSTESTIDTINSMKQELGVIKDVVEDFKKNLMEVINENHNVIVETDKSISIITEQNSAIQLTAASVSEMLSSINKLTDETAGKKENIDSLISNTIEGKTKIENVMVAMTTLEKNISNVVNITKIITKIAQQTNLLAMNAAIEAAHAGEYGHGFNVVAEEIRNLSELTSSQIQNIKKIATTNINSVKNAALMNSEVEKQYQLFTVEVNSLSESIDEIILSMDGMRSVSSHINESIYNLIDLSSHSFEAVDKMKQSVDKSLANIDKLDQYILQLLSKVNAFFDTFAVIEKSTNDIHDIGNLNKEQIEVLNEKINNF